MPSGKAPINDEFLDPKVFDLLLQMLLPDLPVHEVIANVAMSKIGSRPISPASRLAQCLLL